MPSVSTAADAPPPPLNNSTRNRQKTARLQELVEPIPSHPIYYSSTAVSVRLPPSPPLLGAALEVLSCVAQPASLRLVSVPPRHETVRRFDDPPVPLPALLSRPRPYYRLYTCWYHCRVIVNRLGKWIGRFSFFRSSIGRFRSVFIRVCRRSWRRRQRNNKSTEKQVGFRIRSVFGNRKTDPETVGVDRLQLTEKRFFGFRSQYCM